MKKSLFFLMASSSLAFGQELLFQQKPLATDYFANIDILSSVKETDTDKSLSQGIYAADDFEFSRDSKITKLKFTGHVEDGFLDLNNLKGWDIFIYTDSNGVPNDIPGRSRGNNFLAHYNFYLSNSHITTMTMDTQNPKILNVELDLINNDGMVSNKHFVYKANTKYWLVIFSNILDNEAFSITESNKKHFYWAASTSNTPKLEHAKVADPNDFLGYGYTNWTNTNQVNPMVSGLAFELYGEPSLSTNEVKKNTEISVYPNPTADNLNVKSNKKFKSVSIFNAEGRLVIKTDNPLIDVKKLAVGQYIINTEFEDGTKSSVKFIKK